MPSIRRLACVLAGSVLAGSVLTGCADGAPAAGARADQTTAGTPAATDPAGTADEQRFPDVLAVELRSTAADSFDVAVSVSSPYDTPQRYADGWRVLAPDGTVLGEHTLAHDHAGEQPFTRTQPGVSIPEGVDRVTVEGRDQRYGYGGATVTVDVPR